jgi:hypothetical protein
MLDQDGRFSYSRVVSVNRSKNGKFDVVPNPATHNEIRIVGITNTNEKIVIKVFDLSGRLQLMRNVSANGQDIILKHQLPSGMYNVECITKDGKQNKQIIIR